MTPIKRDGSKFVYALKDGETAKATEHGIIVCHPNRPPKIVKPDGTSQRIIMLPE